MNSDFQVIIIGAGAAGLMCAITAAKKGRKVLVLDHANKIGKKILMSGGGRCNFTNYSIEPENYLSHNPHFCKSALSRYNQWHFIELVEQYEIEYFDKGMGQLFCKQSSKDIRDMLVSECQKYGVRIQLKTEIKQIDINQKQQPSTVASNESNSKDSFIISTESIKYHCESLVIATGGLSIPTMGASGFGYKIAEQFGHSVLKTRPALSPLTFSKKWLEKSKTLPGNSLRVQVCCNQQSFVDDMLFTHKGLSGPAILQISSYWTQGSEMSINLLPDVNVSQWLLENKKSRSDIQLKTLLATQFSSAIAEFLCNEIGIHAKLKHLEQAELMQVSDFLSNWKVEPTGYEGYRVAEVTFGGIESNQVSSKSFESLIQPGLYFIGEVLDVTGHLGGYNFQWAWSSGHAAGSYV